MTQRLFGPEFSDALEKRDRKRTNNIAKEALQYYSDQIVDAINPLTVCDTPFVITALRTVANALCADNPRAVHLADMLMQTHATVSANIPVGDEKTAPDAATSQGGTEK